MSSVGTGMAIFFVLFGVGLVFFVVKRLLAVRRARQQFAEKHQFDMESTWWKDTRLRGTYEGWPLEITYESSSQSSNTSYALDLPDSFPESFAFENDKWFWPNREQLRGADTIEVGRPELDDHFVVEAKDPELARSILGGDDVVESLLALDESTTNVRLTFGRLEISDRGTPADLETLETKTDLLAEAADHLASAADARTD